MKPKTKVTARANQQKRTFTLRRYKANGEMIKYRTFPMEPKAYAECPGLGQYRMG